MTAGAEDAGAPNSQSGKPGQSRTLDFSRRFMECFGPRHPLYLLKANGLPEKRPGKEANAPDLKAGLIPLLFPENHGS